MNNYDDIINLEHPTSKFHKRMSIDKRSAIFAPFAALTGYGDAVNETSRLTDSRKELDEGLKLLLSDKLNLILENINSKPLISFTYFVYDKKKSGGKYVTKEGRVRRIDLVNGVVIMIDKSTIMIDEIIDIKGDILK